MERPLCKAFLLVSPPREGLTGVADQARRQRLHVNPLSIESSVHCRFVAPESASSTFTELGTEPFYLVAILSLFWHENVEFMAVYCHFSTRQMYVKIYLQKEMVAAEIRCTNRNKGEMIK